MEITEAYNFLFFDSILAELLFPMQNQIVLPAMVIFGGYDIPTIFSIALFGSVLGGLANWYIGRLVDSACRKYVSLEPDSNDKISLIKKFCIKYEIWIIALCGLIPIIGGVGSVLLGFCGVRIKVFFFIFTLAKAISMFLFIF